MAIARSGEVDCLVLDLIMPDVDGFVLLQQIRGDAATAHLPVVVCSSKLLSADEQALVRRCARAVPVEGSAGIRSGRPSAVRRSAVGARFRVICGECRLMAPVQPSLILVVDDQSRVVTSPFAYCVMPASARSKRPTAAKRSSWPSARNPTSCCSTSTYPTSTASRSAGSSGKTRISCPWGSFRCRRRSKAPSIVCARSKAVPIRSSPIQWKPAVLVATMRAMLRLRQAEAQLREFDRLKNEFLATAAHEIRNPLAPLRHCIELLERSPDRQKALDACLPMMRRQSDHLVRLVDDLADMSRITQNKLTLRISSTDILQAVQSAIEEHRDELEAKKQTLEMDVPDDPVILAGDGVRLSQVFGNLLANGIRYTPQGGRIAIAVNETADDATVTVTDTGEGIDPKDLERSSTCSFRSHRTGRVSASGLRSCTGSFRCTAARSQRPAPVAARSTSPVRCQMGAPGIPGRRASRRRAVPQLVPAEKKRCSGAAAHLGRRRQRRRRRFTREAARGDGARGASGLRRARRRARLLGVSPDVVLMDIDMPDMDGLEAITKIRATTGGDRTLICTLSGYGKGHAARAFEAGADGHLVKPVGREQINAVLARA